MRNFIAIDIQLYKIFKIIGVSFFGTHVCNTNGCNIQVVENCISKRTTGLFSGHFQTYMGGGPSKVLTLYGHIKTAEQRTIIQQYGDWYTGR